MKFLIIFFFILFQTSLYANTKEQIKIRLEKTYNIKFKFTQKIDNKIERGECKISYPKKIFCKYDDIYEKVLVSNGNSLLINSKSIKNYLRYSLENTPLNLILDKSFLLQKLSQVNIIEENDENFFLKITHNNSLVTIFFDKINYDIIGWTTKDVYQNQVETKLSEVSTNLMIDENIFKIQKYTN